MLTITNKIRTIVTLSALGTVLASSAVASAAVPIHQLGTVMTRVAAPPTVVAQDPNKVGSVGNPGYDDQKCEDLANAYNDFMHLASKAYTEGDKIAGQEFADSAEKAGHELSDNCFIMD
jgi:hypothetical protein